MIGTRYVGLKVINEVFPEKNQIETVLWFEMKETSQLWEERSIA